MKDNSDLVLDWLSRAESSLVKAKISQRSKKVMNEDICFDAQQTVEKALKRGIKVEKLSTVVDEHVELMKASTYSKVDIMTLGEAADFYGEKMVRKTKKKKVIDLTGIDRQYVPESLQYLFDEYDGK